MSNLSEFNSDLDNFDSDFMSITQVQKRILARQKKQELRIDQVEETANHAIGFAQFTAKKVRKLEGQEGYFSVKKIDHLIGNKWKTNKRRSDISSELRDLSIKYNRKRIKVDDSNWDDGVWAYDPYVIHRFLDMKSIPIPEQILYAQ